MPRRSVAGDAIPTRSSLCTWAKRLPGQVPRQFSSACGRTSGFAYQTLPAIRAQRVRPSSGRSSAYRSFEGPAILNYLPLEALLKFAWNYCWNRFIRCVCTGLGRVARQARLADVPEDLSPAPISLLISINQTLAQFLYPGRTAHT